MADETLGVDQLTDGNLMALLLKYQHQIEKGLALPHTKLGFGVGSGLLAKLHTYSDALLSRSGLRPHAQFLFEGIGAAVSQYISFHESRNATVPGQATDVLALLDRRGARHTPGQGGAYTVPRDAVLAAAAGDFAQLVTQRHSVRDYDLQRPIPDAVLVDAVRLALEGTPSVCNRQASRVLAIKDPALQQAVLQLQGGSRGHGRPGLLLAVLSDLQIFREPRERNQAYVDGGLFAMSLMYALTHKGLATCPLNFAATAKRDREVRKLLKVPEDFVIICFIAVGHFMDPVVWTVSPRRGASDLGQVLRVL